MQTRALPDLPKTTSNVYTSYIRQFLASPRTVGSVIPSSATLCRTMMNQIDWSETFTIAELGSASGVLTKKVLWRMHPDAQLDAYEINPQFIPQLQAINNKRLNVVAASAEQLIRPYDAIFSCLPLLSMPLRVVTRIMHQVQHNLSPQGTFIQFQYSPFSEKLLSRYFDWQRVMVLKNIPPALVYVCTLRK
ncbi:Phospholipid N-methyltransferase [Izhakiella capsodis]|uniref:Phospholipid N-methyltransferase n=1 Tax=Izhakiella capsodis TaxID=1367852 RepID=A0A1I4WUA1_9GAMM|nr:methyltransferase [Izhakiella capsodis]SFN16763.1 Phospholipid N-methyltransferase [Izhakiella capsodis]